MDEQSFFFYIKNNNEHKMDSYIQIVLDYKEKIITVINLQSNKKNKEYATYLITYSAKLAFENKIYKMVLDDCTNRYRKSNNLYLKLGLTYDDDFGPEMSGSTEKIMNFKKVTKQPEILSYF